MRKQKMGNKDLERIEERLYLTHLLIMFIGLCLWGLFSILFLIIFLSDVFAERFLQSVISFVAAVGSMIMFFKFNKKLDEGFKKYEKITKDNNTRRI